ncbi:mediator of RNA polymerase II transcription complex subunit 8-domain-containing protein [Fusarium redolens]|uniref:Mediator of RNA polymerase II transcription subunit 8 n=1 Tax=Fusarium redolens TaxID=48865 RepID=A0A9P9KY82_FUSRE|nr:mediator of RNA polymerase II transcription complex subunit 8-domain-containing protein [Fusarium redolens]KAH7270627.1 mediator of RNA polymerase II transcription complex subunit 8-domain-containing protein [Fusarium redolens]
MATLNLDDDELKALEQTLSKVAQLSSSVQSFRQDLLKSNPLPPPKSIQASAKILQKNLKSLLESTNENADLFNRMAIRPSTNYPGRTQENVLLQLLRKKLEPDVEEFVSQGLETARLATPEGLESLEQIWRELRSWLSDRVIHFISTENNDPYTAEERATGVKNVRTGLRRPIDDDEDEDEEEEEEGDEEEEDEEPEKPEIPEVKVRGAEPETLLWFAARGDFEVPRNVEYERKVDVYKGLQGINIPPSDQEQQQPQQGFVPS